MDEESSGFDLATLERSLPPLNADSGNAPSSSITKPASELDEDEVRRILTASPLIVTESNRHILEPAMYNAEKYAKESDQYYEKIEELNATLPDEEHFFPVNLLPHFPEPANFFPWYGIYRMSDTNPTSLRNKRFTEPGEFDYPVFSMLQILSVRFAGNFPGDQSMLVYGLVAIRDELDSMRNYIFNRSREQPHRITPDSPTLPLLSPARGNSILDGCLLEYSLKVKTNVSDDTKKDFEIIDGCIEFNPDFVPHGVELKSRIYGSLGPVDIHYAFIEHGIEATIDIEISKVVPNYKLKVVTAYTDGYPDGIVVYDSMSNLTHGQCPISTVVAVELGCELKLWFDISVNNTRREIETEGDTQVQCKDTECFELMHEDLTVERHYLTFTSQMYSCSTDAIVLGDKFKLEAIVTWSTMGPA
uniref:DUF6598 domain-containing protein n=1 Tax=Oryza punctata TaxID=4537 RepID=A0A0E0L4F6_ORYPU